MSVEACTRPMVDSTNSIAYNTYIHFFTHAESMCFYLQSSAFQAATEQAATAALAGLKEGRSATASPASASSSKPAKPPRPRVPTDKVKGGKRYEEYCKEIIQKWLPHRLSPGASHDRVLCELLDERLHLGAVVVALAAEPKELRPAVRQLRRRQLKRQL